MPKPDHADIEAVAAEASKRLVEVYREYGWGPAPKLSPGLVRIVLEVAAERAVG